MGKKCRLPEKQSKLLEGFEPKNKKQQELVDLITNNEIVIVKGIAGSGKTYVTLATAFNLLGDVYKKIILVKSVVPIPGEDIGFTKGSEAEKMAPVMMSFTWNIDKMFDSEGTAESFIDKKIVKILPLKIFRGLSMESAIVIIDETQNISYDIFKTIITRIGEDCKYIFLGDVEQIDRKNKQESCLQTIINIFADTDIIKTLEFLDEDCVRNPKIPQILTLLRANNI